MTRRDVLENQMRRLEEEIAVLDRFGNDDFEEGAVITFDKQFHGPDSKTWTYAGVKVGNLWYLTGSGRHPNCFSWDDLVRFLSEGVGKVYLCKDTEVIF
jgi:hypothetical protein